MADDQQVNQDESTLSIPQEVMDNFPELVEMIIASQSMDDEERQYWVDVLPIMSEEQISNLRGILDNEKTQIEEVNQEYDQKVEEATTRLGLQFDEEKYKEKKRLIYEAEKQHEDEEDDHEEALLKELETM